MLHTGIIENGHNDCGVKINQDVDIAVGAVITARDGTKQRGMSDALRSLVSLALPPLPDDLVACHDRIVRQGG